MIEQNPDCYDYYKGYLASRKIELGKMDLVSRRTMLERCHAADTITEETRSQALQSLHNFSQQFSRASAPLRIALDIALGMETFRAAYVDYSAN